MQPRAPQPHGQPVGHDAQVADLAGGAETAAQQPAVGDDGAADTRADREQRHVGRAAARAEPVLRPARGVRVVVDRDVEPGQQLAQVLAERLAAPVDVGRVVDDRLGVVDEAGGGDAGRGDILTVAAASSIRSTTMSTMATGSPAGVGRFSRRRISPASVTRAPAILVPPMSIPMACTGSKSSGRDGPNRLQWKSPAHAYQRSCRERVLHPCRRRGRPEGERHRPAGRPARRRRPTAPSSPSPPPTAAGRDVTTREFHDQVVALAKGLIAAGITARREDRLHVQDPLRVDADRLRDLVRRRRARADLRDLGAVADPVHPRPTRARPRSSSRPPSTSPGSTRSPAMSRRSRKVWQMGNGDLDKLVAGGRRGHRCRGREAPLRGRRQGPRDAHLHVGLDRACPRAASSPTRTSSSSAATPRSR